MDPQTGAKTVDRTPVEIVNTCNETLVGDTVCDGFNNHFGCFWDGGDCCQPLAVHHDNCGYDPKFKNEKQSFFPNARSCFCRFTGVRYWEQDCKF